MDKIFLHGLTVDCVIGVFEWERRITQKVYIDIDVAFDIGRAAGSDNIDDTLSYKDLSRQVTTLVQEGKFNLVETMAERIAELVLQNANVPWCRIKVNKKGAVSSAVDVGVIIERGVLE